MLDSHAIFIQCLNTTNDKCFILKGVHTINVPPSCQATLPHHITMLDLSYKSESQLKNY